MKILMLLAVVASCSGLSFYEECSEGMNNFATRLAATVKDMAEGNEAVGKAIMLDRSAANAKEEKDFEIQKALAIILASALDEEDPAFVMAYYENNRAACYPPYKVCRVVNIFERLQMVLDPDSNRDYLGGASRHSAEFVRNFFSETNGIFIALMNSAYYALGEYSLEEFIDTDIRVAVSMDDDKVIQDGIPYPQPANASLVIPTVDEEIDEVLQLKECIIEKCADVKVDAQEVEKVITTMED